MFTIVTTNPVSFGFCCLSARAAYRAAAGSAWPERGATRERHVSVRFSLTRATRNESNGVLLVHYSFLDFVICKLWVVNASKAVLWKKYKTNNEMWCTKGIVYNTQFLFVKKKRL